MDQMPGCRSRIRPRGRAIPAQLERNPEAEGIACAIARHHPSDRTGGCGHEGRSDFDGPAEVTDKGITIVAPERIVSREHYPWLYSSEPTLLVLRVTLFKSAEQDKVLQPVLIGTDVKRKLKDGGYLR